jgi:hypothetical protein
MMAMNHQEELDRKEVRKKEILGRIKKVTY